MRDKLRGIAESDYWVYGLSEEDFDYTLSLARGFMEAKRAEYRQYEEKTRKDAPDVADDILDDVAYYTYVDSQYLWHFCIWRLQAVFEGLVVYRFLKAGQSGQLVGLRAKLDAMRAAGYELDDETYKELLAWAKLRNALSHAPPEQFSPGPLDESDVVEYHGLVKGLCAGWAKSQGTVP